MWYIDTIPTDAWVSKWWATVEKKESKWSNIPLKILNPNKSATSSLISNEEKVEKETKKESLTEWLQKRSDYRKKIFSWEISSWNKWADTGEVRKSRLADLARWTLIELGKNPDNIKNISDDDLIKRMTSDKNWANQKKIDLVNNYIKNGWYADEVYDELMNDWKDKKIWYLENVWWSNLSVPVKSVLNLTRMASDAYDSIENWIRDAMWLWPKETREEKLEKQYSIMTEEWYNEWVKNWKKKGSYSSFMEWLWDLFTWDNKDVDGREVDSKNPANWMYEAYDKAKEKWFDWTIEDFKRYTIYWKENNLLDITEKAIDEKYDPNLPWGWVWQFMWEVEEFAFAPELKLKYLSKVPKVWKILKWATKLWAEWAEFQAFDDLYKWELSSMDDYLKSAWTNVTLWWILKGSTNIFTKIPSKKAAAIATKTESEWNRMSKITDDYIKNPNTAVSPYSEITNLLRWAKENLTKNRVKLGWTLEEAEKWLKYWDKAYTANNVVKDIENAFSKLGEWPNAKLPKFNITKDWLKITNKNTLNSISRNENWVTIKLWDELERAWDETFNMFDKQVTPQTTNQFIRKVESILWDSWWNKSGWEWIRTMRETLKNVKKSFEDSLEKTSAEKWKAAKWTASKSINVDKAFDDLIWRLENPKTIAKTDNLWTYNKPEMEELFRVVKEETGIDLNNEIWAWTLNLSLRDPKAAEKLIDTIYPSQPWAMEFIIKSFTNRAKRAGSAKYTKDYEEWLLNRALGITPSMATKEYMEQ